MTLLIILGILFVALTFSGFGWYFHLCKGMHYE